MSHPTYARRILIADAETERAATLRALLHAWGHAVAVVADAAAALRRAETFRPDVVVAGPVAYAVGRRLRQMRALDGVLLVAVTDSASASELACFLATGFDIGLTPPFDPEQLRALVATGTVQSLGA